jgi:hypothetical protein
MTPSLSQTIMVDAQSFGGRFGRALSGFSRQRQTVCDVIAEFLENRSTPSLLQAGAQTRLSATDA